MSAFADRRQAGEAPSGDRKREPRKQAFPAAETARPEGRLRDLPASVEPGGRDVTPGSASPRCYRIAWYGAENRRVVLNAVRSGGSSQVHRKSGSENPDQ